MKFKTQPFAHQLEEWERYREEPSRAVFWDQGTGKTWLAINTTAWLYLQGKIDSLLVIAPNGVHDNWTSDELPAHMPEEVQGCKHTWYSSKARTKWHQASAAGLLESRGLAVLAMTYEGYMTPTGRKFAEKFVRTRREVMCVLDESQRIKEAKAKRTKALVAFGRKLRYKRILTGTPVTNRPFDLYTQLRFLDPDYWRRYNFESYASFKGYFGHWEERIDGRSGQRFQTCVYYRNLDKLAQIARPISSRVTKEEVLDLPPKLYTRRYVEMSSEQRGLYEQLRRDYMAALAGGEISTAPLAVTRLLRFQQVLCGFLTTDDERVVPLKENPRLRVLLDLLRNDVEGKAIVFARFRRDIDSICSALGDECVRYDGAVGDEERKEARHRFQKEAALRFFVANPAAAGRGLTLTAAQTVVYYSNSFNLEDRLQSEDRAHRIGQDKPVRYIDIVTSGTVDVRIVQALRDKRNIAATITGDELKEWI